MRTVGVEEELLIVDESTGRPEPLAGKILEQVSAARRSGGSGPSLTAEFKQEQIELLTEPCTDLGELLDRIRRTRSQAEAEARVFGARVAALATSPVPVETHTTDSPRFSAMMDAYALTAREQLTCGLHVHVGIESDEEGVAIMDRIRIWLPVLTALSANSPFWNGADSGYASYRTQAWSRWPTAGPPEILGSAASYRALIRGLLDSGVPLDEGMMYFDVRLSRKHPTIEVRVADVCLEAADTVVLAGLVRALVETAATDWRMNKLPAPTSAALLRMAAWRASQSGTNGTLLHPLTDHPEPAGRVIEALLDHVRPVLAAYGDLPGVQAGLERIRERGTGERRQRDVFDRTGHLAQVAVDAARITTRPQSTRGRFLDRIQDAGA
ncbi:MAG TPA: carboxylate--amine ligase [Arthrobacter bacterium]|nr:carboxylate--amine ligase [Arthrobacter sp.]HAP90989.1 carboxylate--amine ligase [Arthrobacter sp.]HCB57561.1 carboxylate--amine ligase [Arthrobacter sp.]HCC41049.1 carboxylate--amine ligase [Arthrobacter sp.]